MKKHSCFRLCLLLLSFCIIIPKVQGQNINKTSGANQNSQALLKDGTYSGMSQSKYTLEPYWGKAQITISKGLISNLKFIIRDSILHETFDAKYEKHFEGNAEYIQQSRNDWKGVQNYPGKLIRQQDINKLDAVTGATWSYNIFKASVNEALKNARQ